MANGVRPVLAQVAALRPAAAKRLGARVEALVRAQVSSLAEDLAAAVVGTGEDGLLAAGGLDLAEGGRVPHLKVAQRLAAGGGDEVAALRPLHQRAPVDALVVGGVEVLRQAVAVLRLLRAVLARPGGQRLVGVVLVDHQLSAGGRGKVEKGVN